VVPLRTDWQRRWHAAFLIHRRDVRVMLLSKGVYLVLSLALLVAVVLLRNYMNFIGENGLLVLSGAFNFPLFVVIFLSALFLALSSVATIAREREQGTMETLFYGPVDAVSYILGKYLAHLVVYLAMGVMYALCFAMYAWLTNFTFPARLGWVVLLSILIASNVISFGIFISALSSGGRPAVLFFVGVVVILMALQFGQEVLAALPLGGDYYNPVLFLQNALAAINRLLSWLSPFSFLMQGMEAVRRGSASTYLLVTFVSLIFTLVFLGLSVMALERTGVRAR
jgi:ABC-type transport system involved in multi-copper enzyme maturation permease subunit